MTKAEKRSAFLRSIDDWNAHCPAYFDYFAENARLDNIPPPLPPTVAGARQFYGEIWRAFPDGELTIAELLVDGARIAYRYRFTGHHHAAYRDWPATGRLIEINQAASFLHLRRDGRCVAEWGVQGDDLFIQLEADLSQS